MDPDIGTSAMHKRVRAARGPASGQICVDGCGNSAEHWSKIRGRDDKDIWSYEPRCVRCHNRYDQEAFWRGEANSSAKLTKEKVRAIKASVGATVRELALIHHVNPATIRLVLSGQTWKHIN